MKCPICNVDLVMTERQGIEIDYCPKCRGVWLDRGELDKIIERSRSETVHSKQTEIRHSPQTEYHDHDHDHDKNHSKDHYYKKRSFLLDLFD